MVFFDWDSTKLSPASMNVISQAAGSFKSKGNARITATGHTDTSGTEAYNMALSLRRANSVKDALVREGVPPRRSAWSAAASRACWLRPATACASRRTAGSRCDPVDDPDDERCEYCRILAQSWRCYDRTGAQGPGPRRSPSAMPALTPKASRPSSGAHRRQGAVPAAQLTVS